MAWLDALLAFAITMMVLSTLVSAIVEAGHSLLNQRAKGLERLMQHMFDKVIAPKLAGQLPTDMTGSRFVKQMTDMRWVPVAPNAGRIKKAYYRIVNKLRRTDKAQKLATLEFLERLAESPVGAAVLDRSEKKGDDQESLSVFLEDLASKFEDFGDDASIYFAWRARMFSVLIGFVLVFSINFSAIDVAKTLMQSESARTALIEQGDQIAAGLNAQLQQEVDELKKGGESNSTPDANIDAITQKMQRSVEEGVRTLKDAQLPIGWKHAPWLADTRSAEAVDEGSPSAADAEPIGTVAQTSASAVNSKGTDAANGGADVHSDGTWAKFGTWMWNSLGEFVKWFASVFAAGLLVGLGGPFWFDTYRKLAALSGIAKAFQSEVKQEGQPKQGAGATTEQDDEKRAERFVRIFNTARKASNFAKAVGRQPLARNGASIQVGHIR